MRGSSFAQKSVYALATYSFSTKKEKSVQIGLSADEEAKITAAKYPVILTGPSVQPTFDGARIELELDRQSKILVTYWKKGRESESSAKNMNYAVNHVVTISGLEKETAYEVKLEITDRQNRKTIKNLDFETLGSPGGPVS